MGNKWASVQNITYVIVPPETWRTPLWGHLFLHFVPGMFGPALPPAGVITQGCFTAIHFKDLEIKLNSPHSFIGR